MLALAIVIWSLLAVFLIGLLGVARRRDEFAPPRLHQQDSSVLLLYVLLSGAFVWFMVSVLYGQYLQAHHGAVPSTTPATTSTTAPAILAPDNLLFLSIVPPLLAVICMWLMGRFLMPRGLATIGLRLRRLPAGIACGLLGIFIIMPLVFWSGQLMEWLYARLGLHTPSAHELLRTLQYKPTDWRIGLVVVAAVVVAPLFEETLFRGHLQTWLRHTLSKGLPRLLSERTAAWIAIILTSAIFAVVHPLWMSPMIFVLALGLGYAYERTGNIWTNMTMHALFNLLSIAQYLLMR